MEIMRANWKIMAVIALGFVVLALLNTLTSQPEGYEAFPQRTIFNSKPSGYRAFYLWLKEQNLRVTHWLRDPRDLSTSGYYIRVLVMAEPELNNPADMASILDWVATGNTLVFINGNVGSWLETIGVTSKAPEYRTGRWSAVRQQKSAIYVAPGQPTAYTAGVHTVAVTTDHRLVPDPHPARPVSRPPAGAFGARALAIPPAHYVSHLEDRTGALIGSVDYADGRIILVADPDLAANWNIAQEDNGLLLLNLLRTHMEDGYIAFDEYHHGYREAAFAGYLKNSLGIIAFVQLLIIAGGIVYSKGRRFARPLPVKTEDRRSALEYVQAMAHLYRDAHAYNQALSNIYQRFKTRLCRKNGLAPAQPPEQIAAFMARKGALPVDELSQTLAECEAAARSEPPLSPQRALALVQRLRDYERALRL